MTLFTFECNLLLKNKVNFLFPYIVDRALCIPTFF